MLTIQKTLFNNANIMKTQLKAPSIKPNSNKYVNVANLINKDRIVDTFTKLAVIGSGSNEALAEERIPSTDSQKDIAIYLKDELTNMGFSNASIDENFIVTATLSNNSDSNKSIGLLAHYDTAEDAPNSNVKPQIHKYQSGDINLKDGTVISKNDLAPYKGQEIITSDGTTLLGADDKAGIAEILEALKVLIENPQIKHPEIKVAFTPDEETGCGISKFNIQSFGVDAAYTIDGDVPNVIENESFNAFNPEIIIKGKSVHCGFAKGKMINSINVANWIAQKLPKNQTPQTTEKREGYYHIDQISGNVSSTKINMLVRDFDFSNAQKRIEYLKKVIDKAEKKFGCEIEFNEKERYHNMKEYIDKSPEVMDNAIKGLKMSGLKPETKSIRGGTDGSQLSQRGLPTPNLGAGGLNFHSKSEFLPIPSLTKCCENILNILQVWAENISK